MYPNKSGVTKSKVAKISTSVCFGAIGLFGTGFDSVATASGSTPSSTIVIPQASNAFCNPANRLVGSYSVKIESALGLNDNQPLPNQMSRGIRTAVKRMADSALALSRKAPTAHMTSELRLCPSS
jgi:hypothetical protein